MTAVSLCVAVEKPVSMRSAPGLSPIAGARRSAFHTDVRSALPACKCEHPAAQPWQSFDSLVGMQNFVVHLRRRPVPKGIAALLKAKKLLIGGNLFRFEVARWACNTSAEMVAKLTELVDSREEWIDFLWC
jgi:hypothetical protein